MREELQKCWRTEGASPSLLSVSLLPCEGARD